jgi:hypothetical protein
MDFEKTTLTKSEVNRIHSKLTKFGKYNINLQELEAVTNKKRNIIFALYNKYRGREPYNDYLLLIKKGIYFISAETFWDVKKHNNVQYLCAQFSNNSNLTDYNSIVEYKNEITNKYSELVNKALASLSNGKNQFYFKNIF